MKNSDVLNKTIAAVTNRLEHIHHLPCYGFDNSDLLICSRVIIEMRVNLEIHGTFSIPIVEAMAVNVATKIASDKMSTGVDVRVPVVVPNDELNIVAVTLAILRRHGFAINIINDMQMILKDIRADKWLIKVDSKWEDSGNVEILTMCMIPKYSELYLIRIGLSVPKVDYWSGCTPAMKQPEYELVIAKRTGENHVIIKPEE
jgi:hypothetical protein